MLGLKRDILILMTDSISVHLLNLITVSQIDFSDEDNKH